MNVQKMANGRSLVAPTDLGVGGGWNGNGCERGKEKDGVKREEGREGGREIHDSH